MPEASGSAHIDTVRSCVLLFFFSVSRLEAERSKETSKANAAVNFRKQEGLDASESRGRLVEMSFKFLTVIVLISTLY